MDSNSAKLDVHYIKGNDFHTIYGSGIFGGVTAQGQLNMNFFTERAAIPTKVTYAVRQEADPLQFTEIQREGKEGVVREVQIGVVMDMAVAIDFRDWLTDKIQQFQSINGSIKS